MEGHSYLVMDRLPGTTLNELTYRRPEIIEDHKVTISYQLGMHLAFAYVFGVRDGYQTNYIFDPSSRLITRIDKESFFELPDDADKTLESDDGYTQQIALSELSNLKYIPSFRDKKTRPQILYAYKTGFVDKYNDMKAKRRQILELVNVTRINWIDITPIEDIDEYAEETLFIQESVDSLISQDPEKVFERLVAAKIEVERK